MTTHTPFAAHHFVVKAEVSGTMTKICALTTRSFSRSVQTSPVTMPRSCDDPDLVPGVDRIPTAIDATISGEARYHKELRSVLDGLLGEKTTMQFIVPGAGADGGGYWQGIFMLTTVDISGEDGDHMVASVTWELADAEFPAWVAAA